MTESFAGQQARASDPRCYNCGAADHWTVACPEPTRETPAYVVHDTYKRKVGQQDDRSPADQSVLHSGLEAWRNATASAQWNGRSHTAGPQHARGPVITKYSPHPPSQPPTFGSVMPHYPVPLPHPPFPSQPPLPSVGSQQGQGPFPGPNPLYQSYASQPPPYPPGYAQPHVGYPPHQYSPPNSFAGPPQHDVANYMRQPNGVPPLTATSVNVGQGQYQYRPPPPSRFNPPHPAQAGHQFSPSTLARSGFVRASGATLPPKQLASILKHPLPPKPPPSLDQMKMQREYRDKRKNDRSRNHNDHRFGDSKAPNMRRLHSSQQNIGRANTNQMDRPPTFDGRSPNENLEEDNSLHRSPSKSTLDSLGSRESLISQDSAAAAFTTVSPTDGSMGKSRLEVDPWANGKIRHLEHSGPVKSKEATVAPSVSSIKADEPSHVPWISTANPVHSNRSSQEQDEGEVAQDESKADSTESDEFSVHRAPEPNSSEEKRRRKRDYSVDSDSDERYAKRKARRDSSRRENELSSEKTSYPDSSWEANDGPEETDSHRKAPMNQTSRHSSVSSETSSLNSLELELLGRPNKHRQAEPSPSQRRGKERTARSKAKPRNRHSNSAYSERTLEVKTNEKRF